MSAIFNNTVNHRMRFSASLFLTFLLAACGGGGGGGSTEDVIAPTVASFTPAEGMTNVPNNAVLSITFDEALDASTLTGSSFSLTGASSVMGTVTYDANTNTASFTPDAPLELDVLHTATLTTTITDSAGNPLAAVFSLTFTTETFIQRMSEENNGAEGLDSSRSASISADGRYVAFHSSANNLLGAGNDANNSDDVFVRDTQTNTITRVSIASDGTEANDPSADPSISADGRYVAFSSSATNLLGANNDMNGISDIFVRDTQTNTTTRVSVASDGTEATSPGFGSVSPRISADGRYVAFRSDATNLLGANNDTNGSWDVFVRDTQTNTTTRVSVANDGSEANDLSYHPSISADGRYVAFTSNADNLLGVGNDTNGLDIFVRDTVSNTTTRVSVANNGIEAEGSSYAPSISVDGRYVAFSSDATNLLGASNDTNGMRDIFVRDTQTNTTTRVSIANDGTEANDAGDNPSISGDGRYVAFESAANNLLDAGNNTTIDVFIRDTQTNTTIRVSVANDGSAANAEAEHPSISADGRYVAFESYADNLSGAGNDMNLQYDIFRVLNTTPPSPVIVSDRRLKKDIVYLASLENGIKLYAFKYLWSDDVYVGVMAQDLLKMPAFSHAVHQMQGNYYAVDYQALGLKMIRKSAWLESTDNLKRTSPAAT